MQLMGKEGNAPMEKVLRLSFVFFIQFCGNPTRYKGKR